MCFSLNTNCIPRIYWTLGVTTAKRELIQQSQPSPRLSPNPVLGTTCSSVLLKILHFLYFWDTYINIQIHYDEINRWKVWTEVEEVKGDKR